MGGNKGGSTNKKQSDNAGPDEEVSDDAGPAKQEPMGSSAKQNLAKSSVQKNLYRKRNKKK